MPKYQAKTEVLDAKLDAVISQVDTRLLVRAYAAGDAYATVVANTLASAGVVGGDWAKADDANDSRKATLPGEDASVTAGTSQQQTGIATSGAVNNLTDTAKAWTVDEHAARKVEITAGTGAGQIRRIASNTATALTPETDFATAPDITSEYRIYDDLHQVLVDSVNSKVIHVTDETSDQSIYAGNTITFPAVVIRENQPV